MDKDGFIKALLDLWADHDWMDLDGDSLQAICAKHGLLIERPATAEDCETEQAHEFDIELGDPFFVWSDEAQTIRRG